MRAQRIVIVMHDFFRGGTERGAIRFAREWTDEGRDVVLLCGSAEGGLRDAVDPRVQVVMLDPPVPRSALSRLRLGRAMGEALPALKADIVFLPGNFHLPLARGLRQANPRTVLAQQISNPPLPGGVVGMMARPFFRFFAKAVDGFAAMNNGLMRDIRTLMPEKPVIMLRPPFEIADPVQRTHSGGPSHILWVGRLEPQKDAGLALETIKALNQEMPARLTILGQGAQREEVRRKIAGLGLAQTVTLLSQVPDLAPYYADADALLITSHYEGGPAVAVEALAQGTPVVSTDCSPLLREVLTDVASGIITDTRAPQELAAALAAICRRPRPSLEPLRALATPFRPEVSARAYLDWFDSLVRHG
ncbi:MAG: glycosyltransferase [Alphaproteobacteria bacterium]|nr:glycosyltransferase [Alphaproteobacteria bacterium]